MWLCSFEFVWPMWCSFADYATYEDYGIILSMGSHNCKDHITYAVIWSHEQTRHKWVQFSRLCGSYRLLGLCGCSFRLRAVLQFGLRPMWFMQSFQIRTCFVERRYRQEKINFCCCTLGAGLTINILNIFPMTLLVREGVGQENSFEQFVWILFICFVN